MNSLYKRVKPDRVVQLAEGVRMGFRFIRGGPFLQGSDNLKSEQPIRKVTVPDFYLGIYPVTNAQYAAFLNDYGQATVRDGPYINQVMITEDKLGVQKNRSGWGYQPQFSFYPITQVTWYGANTFCEWLSSISESNYCLPTEMEWEYAACGGGLSNGLPFSGSKRLDEAGWYNENSHMQIKQVGLKAPNELNLFDMSGNVMEWCSDDWLDECQEESSYGSDWIEKCYKVVRGGYWGDVSHSCKVSSMSSGEMELSYPSIGFRILGY